MSKSGLNSGFARCFILFIAIVILLEGIIYFGLSIWGILYESCSYTADPFAFVVKLIYFIRQECGNPYIETNSLDVGTTNLTKIDIDWEKSEIITNRMFIFLIVYICISALWIVTSAVVIVTICLPIIGCTLAIAYWPWFIVVLAGSVLDAVATGYHVHDIVHTTSGNETFAYIGAYPSTIVYEQFQALEPYFLTPAVIMTCISSRVVLIWLLNIFGVSFSLSLYRTMAQEKAASRQLRPSPLPVSPYNPMIQSRPDATSVGMIAQLQQPQQEQIQVKATIVEDYRAEVQPKPIQVAQLPQQYQNVERGNFSNPQSPIYTFPPTALSSDLNSNNMRQHEVARQQSANEITSYRNTDAHPDKLNYPQDQKSSVRAATPVEFSYISPLNNRYSSAEVSAPPLQSNPRVSAELRSQLPWSYTSMQPKPQPPPKPQPKMYPSIPEPDYAEDDGVPNNNVQHSQQSYSRW